MPSQIYRNKHLRIARKLLKKKKNEAASSAMLKCILNNSIVMVIKSILNEGRNGQVSGIDQRFHKWTQIKMGLYGKSDVLCQWEKKKDCLLHGLMMTNSCLGKLLHFILPHFLCTSLPSTQQSSDG